MKEINLLPKWYKLNKREQFNRRVEHTALLFIVSLLIVWNLTVKSKVSNVRGELVEMQQQYGHIEKVAEECRLIKRELCDLQSKLVTLDKLKSRIDVSSVLAELSYLISKNVVLGQVTVSKEYFSAVAAFGSGDGGLRKVAPNVHKKQNTLYGDVKFTVSIFGIASDGSEVAELICKLEESRYFRGIIPRYSRNTEIATGTVRNKRKRTVTEFSISCYLANFIETGD